MTKSYHDPRKSQGRPWRKKMLLWGGLALLVFSVGLVVGYFRNTQVPDVEPVVVAPALQLSKEVILYFASADGQFLVAETRKINDCELDEDCLRGTFQALVDGPQSDLSPILPSQVSLLGVAVDNSLVAIDFSPELVAAHPGGTQSELLTVYALANTLAVNFPHLRQVQILIEGSPATTIKGHIDLRQPVNPDFSLVKESPAPVGKMIDLPAGGDE